MSKLNFITMMCSWVQTEHHMVIVLLFHQEIGSKKLKVSRDALKISRLTK